MRIPLKKVLFFSGILTLYVLIFGSTGICPLCSFVTKSLGISLKSGPTSSSISEVRTASSWKLKDVQGNEISSDDFKGKVMIIDFWATWCPPCRAEIPGFVELQKKYKEKGLVVIGISLDQQGPEVVQSFMKEYKINYPVVMATEKVSEDFGGIESIPTTFIIDRKGNIVSKHVGLTESAVFEKEIAPLL